jgi:hypothetical protein
MTAAVIFIFNLFFIHESQPLGVEILDYFISVVYFFLVTYLLFYF